LLFLVDDANPGRGRAFSGWGFLSAVVSWILERLVTPNEYARLAFVGILVDGLKICVQVVKFLVLIVWFIPEVDYSHHQSAGNPCCTACTVHT
jgi:hypothetical protein